MSLNEIDFLYEIKKDIQSLLSSLYELLGITPEKEKPKPPKRPPETPSCKVVQTDRDDDVYLECIDCSGSCKMVIYNDSDQRKQVKVYRDGVEEFQLTIDPHKKRTINTSCSLIYNYKHRIKVVSPPKEKPKPPPKKPRPPPKKKPVCPTQVSGDIYLPYSKCMEFAHKFGQDVCMDNYVVELKCSDGSVLAYVAPCCRPDGSCYASCNNWTHDKYLFNVGSQSVIVDALEAKTITIQPNKKIHVIIKKIQGSPPT